MNAPRSEWQSIETAPKDGTLVDLWVVGGHDGLDHYEGVACRETDCLWFTESAAPRWVRRGGDDAIEDHGLRATHWMPLPDPPVSA